MIPAGEYLKYLDQALAKYHVHGYLIEKKANNKWCLFKEDKRWIVAKPVKNMLISSAEYEEDAIWLACEDLIARVTKNEEQRKKVWTDWATNANWAEKMNEPLSARLIRR